MMPSPANLDGAPGSNVDSAPSQPLAGLNLQKSSLLLYPTHLTGHVELYHPETRTFIYETLDLPLAQLRTASLHGIARTPRIFIAYAGLLAALVAFLLNAPFIGCGGLGLFLLLRFLLPIRLLHFETATGPLHLPVQWWERPDTHAFLTHLKKILQK